MHQQSACLCSVADYIGVEPQAGADEDMGASGGEKFEYVNIHGAIYVETGRTHMLEAGTVNA